MKGIRTWFYYPGHPIYPCFMGCGEKVDTDQMGRWASKNAQGTPGERRIYTELNPDCNWVTELSRPRWMRGYYPVFQG